MLSAKRLLGLSVLLLGLAAGVCPAETKPLAKTPRGPRSSSLGFATPSILSDTVATCREAFLLFVRTRFDATPPADYLHNQKEGLALFDAWFRDESAGGFDELLENINRVALVGKTGTRPYFALHGQYSTQDVTVGHRLSRAERGSRVGAMEAVLRLIREVSPREVTANADARERFLDLLYEYYDLSMGEVPGFDKLFHKANNSIFMAQVNYLLEVYGFSGFPHGHADNARERRREVFFRLLVEANPGVRMSRSRGLDTRDKVTQDLLTLWLADRSHSAEQTATRLNLSPELVHDTWQRFGLLD